MFASRRLGLDDSGTRAFSPALASGGLTPRRVYQHQPLPLTVEKRPILRESLGPPGSLIRGTPLSNALAGTLVSPYGMSLLSSSLYTPTSQYLQCPLCQQLPVLHVVHHLVTPYVCHNCLVLANDYDPYGLNALGIYDLQDIRDRLIYGWP